MGLSDVASRSARVGRIAAARVSGPDRRESPEAILAAGLNGLAVVYRDPSSLKPRAINPRTHSKKQIQQIAASVREFGFLSPILIDDGGCIVAGHGRNDAAKLNGMTRVPTIQVDHLTPEQIRAFVIADNQIAANAGWDLDVLALELKELSLNFNFDVTLTGFETAQIDLLMDGGEEGRPNPDDDVQEADRSRPAIAQIGDLWGLGRHRLLCGDATKRDRYELLLGAEKAQMVFADPPYNVPVDGHARGLGRIRHHEFPMASGEMTGAEYTTFLKSAFQNLAEFSCDGSIHAICMDWRHTREIQAAADGVYSEIKNICVWVKSNGGMGSFYRSQHEFVFIYKSGTAPHINNIELGKYGRNRTNVWTYPGVNAFGKGRNNELAMHPTVKPLALVTDAISDCSKRGGVVLDAFAGSGTTLIAADNSGRRGYGIELDPYYVDTTLVRFRDMVGFEPVLLATGEKFVDVRLRRLAERDPARPRNKSAVDNLGQAPAPITVMPAGDSASVSPPKTRVRRYRT